MKHGGEQLQIVSGCTTFSCNTHYVVTKSRHTSLQKLFPAQRKQARKAEELLISEGLRAHVHKLVDARCTGSVIVIVNGAYVPSLSNITSVADRITTDSAEFFTRNYSACDGLKDSVRRMTTFLPDADEAPRNSFGSSHIAALTMVSSPAFLPVIRLYMR
jgi:hypothetical protein